MVALMAKLGAFLKAAQAATERRTINAHFFIQAAKEGLSKTSWWLDARDRDEFSARAKQEQPRMHLWAKAYVQQVAIGRKDAA